MAGFNIPFDDDYTALGFSSNPFMVRALAADERGLRLMVGRDDHVNLVARRLHKEGKITCLDGHVGVGKTSLVNVAAYQCFQAFLRGEASQLLIPLKDSFQLKTDEDVHDFCDSVFRKVASCLLEQRETLTAYSLPEKVMRQVDSWLRSPVIEEVSESISGGFSGGIPAVAGATSNATRSSSTRMNTSSGFAKDGFEQLVRRWLDDIFSVQGSGGVVCVIDNLELLETGPNARRILEALRDRLFTVNGLRWVFCGANGVIHSLASSPRLGAFLNTPIIDVKNITIGHIEPLIEARLKEFYGDVDKAKESLPVLLEDIKFLYPVINFNLRDLLAFIDEYCEHQFSINRAKLTNGQKAKRFQKYLDQASTESYKTLSSRIPSDAWVVLDIAMGSTFKGTIGVGNYREFSSNSKLHVTQASFERWLKTLVRNGLIEKDINDEDELEGDDDRFKRSVFTVTAKGALVHYARLVKQENQSMHPRIEWLQRVHH
jgi:hypothetical protein